MLRWYGWLFGAVTMEWWIRLSCLQERAVDFAALYLLLRTS